MDIDISEDEVVSLIGRSDDVSIWRKKINLDYLPVDIVR